MLNALCIEQTNLRFAMTFQWRGRIISRSPTQKKSFCVRTFVIDFDLRIQVILTFSNYCSEIDLFYKAFEPVAEDIHNIC